MSEKIFENPKEIDLLELFRHVLSRKILIIKICALFFLLGIFVAFSSVVEFEAMTRLLPESKDSSPSLGGLASLASLAGADIGGIDATKSALKPELYPEILGSYPFLKKVYEKEVNFEQLNKRISAKEYFEDYYEPSFIVKMLSSVLGAPSYIKGWFISEKENAQRENENSEILRFSKEEFKSLNSFRKRVSVNVDQMTGIITIGMELPDPQASAEVLFEVKKALTEAVTSYHTERVRRDLSFVNSRYIEAKNKYENLQRKLAVFKDSNRNVSTSIAEIKLQGIEHQYNIAYEIYKGLASKLEQKKIEEKEEAPIFTVLEPVQVPVNKSKPKRKLIILAFVAIGMIVSIAWVALGYRLKKLK